MLGRNTSAAQAAYYRKYHQPYRDRDPKEVHEALQRMFKRSSDLGKRNSEWFDSTPDKFMAKYYPKDGESDELRTVIYHMDHKERSHHNDYIWEGQDRKWALALRDSELPLYAHDESLDNETQRIIQQRLKGELKEIPIIQDLHDEKEVIDRKWSRVRSTIGALLEYFKNIIWDEISKVPRRYDFTKVYVLEVEGTEYHFLNDRGVTYLDPGEVKRLKL
jgi:hypothetical protein